MARTLELDTIQFPSASNGTNITLEDGLTKFNTVNVDINGGNIDGTAIGANATSTGAFSTISGTLADGVTATTQATSDNTTKVATTAYVKAVATAEDLDIAGDTGTGAVDLDSQSLTVAGTTNEIVTVASGQTITVSLPATINAATTGNAATATAATNITVEDESTNTTCFPVFTTAATGNQAPKSGSNLTFDSADGILGATTFSGSGASLTTLNGTNISTGTVAAARVATLNQNTTGSAATLTTGRTISTTGDVAYTSSSFTGAGNVTGTATIANDAVTYAKIQNVSADERILGRVSGADGPIEELTQAQAKTFIGDATTSANGLMSGADKTTLGNLGGIGGAEYYLKNLDTYEYTDSNYFGLARGNLTNNGGSGRDYCNCLLNYSWSSNITGAFAPITSVGTNDKIIWEVSGGIAYAGTLYDSTSNPRKYSPIIGIILYRHDQTYSYSNRYTDGTYIKRQIWRDTDIDIASSSFSYATNDRQLVEHYPNFKYIITAGGASRTFSIAPVVGVYGPDVSGYTRGQWSVQSSSSPLQITVYHWVKPDHS